MILSLYKSLYLIPRMSIPKSFLHSKHTNAIFLIIFLQTVLSSSDLSQIIHINTFQIHTLSSEHPQSFKIPNTLSPTTGRFHISIAPIEPGTVFHIITNHRTCNQNLTSRTVTLENASHFQGVTTISFVGNTSDSHCFDINVKSNSRENILIDHKIGVMFAPTQKIFDSNSSFELKIDDNTTKQDLTYSLKNKFTKLLFINIVSPQQTSSNSNNFINSTLELRSQNETCIKSQSKIIRSWLCDLSYHTEGILEFTFSGLYGSPGSFQVSILEVEPERVTPDFKIFSYSFLPGFGTLFDVNLSSLGILEIKTISKNGNCLPIRGGRKLNILLQNVAQNRDLTEQFDCLTSKESTNDSILRFENDQIDSNFYYIVHDTMDSEYFELESRFMQRLTVDIKTEVMYYFDPQKEAYRYIELIPGKLNVEEKYEITFEAEQPNSQIYLFLNASNPFRREFLGQQSKNYKKVFIDESYKSQITLSFTVQHCNTPLYLTLYAPNKGFYQLRITKVRVRAMKEILMIFLFLAPLIGWMYFYILKVLLNGKIIKFHDNTPNTFSNPPFMEARPGDTTVNIQSISYEDDGEERNDNNDYERESRQITKETEVDLNSLKFLSHFSQQTSSDDLEEYRCDICFEAKKSVRFLPCNHACSCAFCALIIIQTSMKCPLCRGKIRDVI